MSTEYASQSAGFASFQDLALERAHDLIAVCDPAGVIVYASPSWATLGWDPAELAGRQVLDFIHPDDAGRGTAGMAQVAAGGEVEAVTARYRTADGRWIWFEASGAPIHGPDGRVAYLVGVARDVSEREALKERVQEVDALYRVADAIARASSLDELLDEADVMRFRAWRGLSDEYRSKTEGHTPWTPETRDPEPVLVPDVVLAGF